MKIIKNVIDKEIIKDDEIEEVEIEEKEYPLAENGIRYGYDFEHYNDIWKQGEIQENLERFFNNDFGKISENQKQRNLANQEKEEGDMVAIYSKDNDRTHDMVIYYDDLDKIIYILLRSDFEEVKEAWLVGSEQYEKEYESGRVKTDPKDPKEKPILVKYGEPGHQLTKSQKESLRETYSGKEEKDPDRAQVSREALHFGTNAAVHESEIEATKKAIEEKFGNETIKELTDLANKYNVKYDDIVEKITEVTILKHKNLENSIKEVKEHISEPYFFVKDEIIDPKKLKEKAKEEKRLNSIRWNESSIANIISNWFYSLSDDIDRGEITAEELANEAIALVRNKLDTPYVNEKFIPTLKEILNTKFKYEYQKLAKVAQYFDNLILKTEGYGVLKDSDVKDEKPAWLEEELIDDIVYSKEWPTTIEEVAEELMKYGIKERHEAIGYVKEYLNDNPSELKHFKVTKDSKKVNDSKVKDMDEFLEKTNQGFEIHSIYANEEGRLYAIVYRPLRKDWAVGAGYDVNKGYWNQGYYDFPTKTAAIRYLFKHYPDEEFDIYWEK